MAAPGPGLAGVTGTVARGISEQGDFFTFCSFYSVAEIFLIRDEVYDLSLFYHTSINPLFSAFQLASEVASDVVS
jgi:hypothetical protein